MKTRLFIFFISVLLFSSLLAEDKKVYVSYAMAPFEITGLKNVHLSDKLGSTEGRLNLNLTDGESEGMHPGALIGGAYIINDNLSLSGELSIFVASNAGMVLGAFGFDVKYPISSFYVGFSPKIGFGSINIHLGKAKQIPGYFDPVITNDGTISDGDELSGIITGFNYQVMAITGYRISESFEIVAQGGFTHTIFGDMKINSGETTIKNGSGNIVETDYSYTRSDLQGEGESIGLMFSIGVGYYL